MADTASGHQAWGYQSGKRLIGLDLYGHTDTVIHIQQNDTDTNSQTDIQEYDIDIVIQIYNNLILIKSYRYSDIPSKISYQTNTEILFNI